MKIVICEDEKYWQDEIRSSICTWAKSKRIEIQCIGFSSPEKLIKYLAANTDIDVIFIDISLGDEVIDGVDAAKHIRKTGSRVPIIFVTANSNRAVDGYLVEAMGFLCKPIDEKRLSLFLSRLMKQKQSERVIHVMSEVGAVNIPLKEIVYLEIINHTVHYHTRKRILKVRGTLVETLGILGENDFIQIHRSFLISKSKIHGIKTSYPHSVDLLAGDKVETLTVSRSYIEKLLEAYSDNILEMMI